MLEEGCGEWGVRGPECWGGGELLSGVRVMLATNRLLLINLDCATCSKPSLEGHSLKPYNDLFQFGLHC